MSVLIAALSILLATQDEELRTPAIYRCPTEEAESHWFEEVVGEYYFDAICIEPSPGPSAKAVAAGRVKLIKPNVIDTPANRKWRDATIDFANGKISPKTWLERTQNLKETVHFLSNPNTPTLREATGRVSHRAVLAEMLTLSLPGTPCFTADDVWRTRYLPDDDVHMSWVLAMNDYLGPMLYYRCEEPFMVTGKPEILRADAEPGLLVFRLSEGDESLTFYFNNSEKRLPIPEVDLDLVTIGRGIDFEEDEVTAVLVGGGSLIVDKTRDDQVITAELEPKMPEGRESLRWSPKGAAVKMTAGRGGLSGSIHLGPKDAPAVAIQLQKVEGADRYNQLWVDLNRDGQPDDKELFKTTPTERTGKWWSSFDGVTIPIAVQGGEARPYPISVWFVEDPLEPNVTPDLRWSRRGWHEGVVEINGEVGCVLITEMNMDGVFDQRDAWFLARDRTALLGASSRGLEDHTWLDGIAYRVTKIDPDGRTITFESYDPGFTEEEEKTQRDTLLPDRQAERAEKPVPFLHDYQAAMNKGKSEKKRVLVDFEAVWCGPCKTMDELVYTAKDVVEAAANVVPVKVDGDVSRDLVKQYGVGAYPTLILLDENGKEIRRAVGYRSVAQMVEFLKP